MSKLTDDNSLPCCFVWFGFFCFLFLFDSMKAKKFHSLAWRYQNTSKPRQQACSCITLDILFWILSECCSSCKKHFCCPSGQLLHKSGRGQDHTHGQPGNRGTAWCCIVLYNDTQENDFGLQRNVWKRKRASMKKIQHKIKTVQFIAYQNIGNTAIDICIGHSEVL